MMPSVVKPNPASVGSVASTGAVSVRSSGSAGKKDVCDGKSQLLVRSESGHHIKSASSGSATCKSSSVGNRASKLADKSPRQKVDVTTPVAANAVTTRVVSARNSTVKTTRVKPSAAGSAQSGLNGQTENRNVSKTTSTSATAVRLSTGKTAVYKKSVVESSHREDISASVNKPKSTTVAASVTGGVKHEAACRGRVVTTSQSKSAGAASSLTAKKSLKQTNSRTSTTTQTSQKRDKALEHTKDKHKGISNNKKSSNSEISISFFSNKVGSNEDATADSVDNLEECAPAVDNGSSSCSDCVLNESHEASAEASDCQSPVSGESQSCESAQSCRMECQCVSTATDVILPVACTGDDGSDLEENSVCDISFRSDCSVSLFHSACSSIIGSVSDVKAPALNNSFETGDCGMLLQSNSVSTESLPSSTGYCTPSEHDNVCEVTICTASNSDDSRYV